MDKRREPRIELLVKFFVHVHECAEDPDLAGVSIDSEALDFSSHGVQFRTDQDLALKTLLNITIGIGDPFAMYLLRGEIRWTKPEDDEYYVGVMLNEAEGTDLDAWIAYFERPADS